MTLLLWVFFKSELGSYRICQRIILTFFLVPLSVSGRAIRHINDYAAILLVDSRYSFTSDSSKRMFSHPSSKLPEWIKGRLVSADNYGEVHRMLHHFFKYNKNR